jgi:DNA-binding LacI/PurR family transcriptional regulator
MKHSRSAKSYVTVKNAVRGMILSGEHKHGDLLLTELELAHRFSVSRPTVHRAMRELAAEGLVRRRPRTGTVVNDPRKFVTGTVAVLSHEEFGAAHTKSWLRAMRETLIQEGFFTVPYVLGQEADRAEQFVRMLVQRGISAAVLAPASRTDSRLLDILESAGVVTLVAGRFDAPDRQVSSVSSNHTQGAALLAEHAIELGHRQAAVIGDFNSQDAMARRDGFTDAFIARGGAVPRRWQIHVGDRSSIQHITPALMAGKGRPTVIFGTNDHIAMEVMLAMHEGGLRIPQDASVVGMGGDDWTRATISPMTTVEVPMLAEGNLIARMILARLADPELPVERVELDCRLVERESCGVPPSQAGHRHQDRHCAGRRNPSHQPHKSAVHPSRLWRAGARRAGGSR